MEAGGQAFEALLKDGTNKADFGEIGHVDVTGSMPIEVTLTAKGIDKLVVTMSGTVNDPAEVQINDFDVVVAHGSTVRRSTNGRRFEVSFGEDKSERLTSSVVTRQLLQPLPMLSSSTPSTRGSCRAAGSSSSDHNSSSRFSSPRP